MKRIFTIILQSPLYKLLLTSLLFPLALNAMENGRAIVAPPTNYKLEEIYDFEDAPFYQQLQITVSLSDTNQTATDIVRQFITHKGTCIPHAASKDVATVSLDSGYSAVVTYKHLLNDEVKLLYKVDKASLLASLASRLSNWAPGTQVAKDSIKTKINEEYTVPIVNVSIFDGLTVGSTLKIKALLFTHTIPKTKNLARDRNRSGALTSNTER